MSKSNQIARLTPNQSDRLESLGVTINAEWAHANSLAKQATEKYIMVGMHLLEARSMFPGDKEFGQWAADQIPEIQKRWRSSLMAVARKFVPILEQKDSSGQPAAVNLLSLLPVSTLNELVPASEETLDRVVARLRNGEKITKTEARSMARSEKTPTSPPPPTDAPRVPSGGGTTSSPVAPDGEPPVASSQSPSKVVLDVPPVETRTLALLTLPFLERIKMSDDPMVIFGFNPFVDDIILSLDSLEVLYGLLCKACNQKQMDKLTAAYEDLRDEVECHTVTLGLGVVAHRVQEGYYD